MQDTRVRRSLLKSLTGAAFLAFLAVSLSAGTVLAQGNSDNSRNNILFTQQDQVKEFSLETLKGYQVGTATGKISGTTSVVFAFAFPQVSAGQPNLAFTNHVTITDIDGDQIFFLNEGTGFFNPPPSSETFFGSGGPLTGTYKVTSGTGKYASWRIGTTYRYRAVATNPAWGYLGIVPGGALGTVYVEVYSNPLKKTD